MQRRRCDTRKPCCDPETRGSGGESRIDIGRARGKWRRGRRVWAEQVNIKKYQQRPR